MFKFRDNVVFRFNLLVIFVFTTWAVIIMGSAAIIMFKERDFWLEIKKRFVIYK